jgi:hypothetical protein
VLEEALILGGHEGALHELGDVGDRHRDAAVAGLVELGVLGALAVEDVGRAGQPQVLEAGVIRQIGGSLVEEADDVGDVDRRRIWILVLAELLVRRLEVGEVDAVERLDVTRQRLRIGERGVDEIARSST